MKAPKTIVNHPAVKECEYGPSIGFEEYKHAVYLKEGWVFKRGRMEGIRSGNFNTVKDFLRAEPVKVK